LALTHLALAHHTLTHIAIGTCVPHHAGVTHMAAVIHTAPAATATLGVGRQGQGQSQARGQKQGWEPFMHLFHILHVLSFMC
jgi:hypothetical protein